jgi:hypothetical protein
MCDAFRAIVGCLIFMAIIGPILIIVGLVMIFSENNREASIREYNNAVSSYQSYVTTIESWTGSASLGNTLDTYTMATARESVSVIGNTDGVSSATSTLLRGQLKAATQSNNVQYAIASKLSMQRSFAFTKTLSTNIQCSGQSCSKYCHDSSDRQCDDDSILTRQCQRVYSPEATFHRTRQYCDGDDVCGYCSYVGYASRLCAVVKTDTGGQAIIEDTSKLSCDYPFALDSGEYSATKPTTGSDGTYSVTVEVRINNDPYIVLQSLTRGSRDFGITAREQRGVGIGLLLIGCLITVLVCGGAVYMCRQHNQKKHREEYRPEHHQQAQMEQYQSSSPGYSTYGQPAPVYGQAQVYQQQPTYGEPQPAYGQPQPVYGQPQSTYQPQPMYQQQPGYGQPPHDQQAYGKQL